MYNRFISHSVAEALEDTPAILITGARQTGKSTLCRQLIETGRFKGQSVTMDDPAILTAALADPMGFLEDLDKHVIIDEVQRAPELFLSIKKLIDEDRNGRRIILTGSADVMTLPKVADSLAGRIEIHNLWPLSQNEIQGRASGFLKMLVSESARFPGIKTPWKDIVQMIRKGGYPEAVLRKSDTRRAKWFESYIMAILQKDIRELANIEGLMQLPNVLQLIATRVGSTVNLSDIARLSGIKNTTLQRYIALLEQVFLILKIPAWTPNAEGQFVKSPKIFINDTGLLCHLRGEGDSLLENRTMAGSFLENFVVMELIKQLSWNDDDSLKPYHFSIHKGAEVDLVLEDRRKQLYGIEIKSTATIRENDFRGLKKLAELVGKRFKKGIVLYTGEHTLGGFGRKDLYAVPITALWST
ncbi:ATP-binding protein [Sinomicrobium soli]|uniref:ATP-binding protein n=1 Tax=Sinomicrobium sp. N-1-3-6 TaxID=2219864 RepID=UPI000DCCDFEF|nr:ATP-binding protein [Sinomicrobium sp. N-1-3-6]RAV27541.1 ATP-binding protein [Sinomicrobium sp. N-1-3-6]